MKIRLTCLFFSLFFFILPDLLNARISLYITNGFLRPIGKVDGVGFTTFSPYKKDATRFYLESYNIGLGFGFTPSAKLGQQFRITGEFNLSPVMRLTDTGQKISDASTGFGPQTNLLLVEFSVNVLFSLLNPMRYRLTPFSGLGIHYSNMNISAKDYSSESLSVTGLHAITGIDLMFGKDNSRCFQLEIRYMPNLQIGHIPGFLRFNVGLFFVI